MVKFLYKAVSLLASVLGGILAAAIFKRAWKLAAGEDEAPTATDVQRGWTEVLVAAALQGAIFALIKAALDRGLTEGASKLTGEWLGDDSKAAAQAAADQQATDTKA